MGEEGVLTRMDTGAAPSCFCLLALRARVISVFRLSSFFYFVLHVLFSLLVGVLLLLARVSLCLCLCVCAYLVSGLRVCVCVCVVFLGEANCYLSDAEASHERIKCGSAREGKSGEGDGAAVCIVVRSGRCLVSASR